MKQEETKKRLLEFLTYLGIGQTKFEEKVGISRGLINNIKGGISSTTISKIAESYPELNTDWLLNGSGEMIRNNQQVGNVNGNGIQITHNDLAGMIDLQKGYQELLKKKDDHITELLSIVGKLTNND
jgi:transcriptional regulator with XRE-family HTH domain